MKKRVYLGLSMLFLGMLGTVYFLGVHKLGSGYVDKFYPKFTQPAGSLLVGLSRVQYGLAPAVIARELPNVAQPIVNFGFEMFQASYSAVLLEDIQAKIAPETTNGIFLLGVSPASFAVPKGFEITEIKNLDNESILGKMTDMTSSPNYEYIRKCYGSALYKGIFQMKPFGNITVHNDGWIAFAESYDYYTVSEQQIAEWTTQTLESYQGQLALQEDALYRWESFIGIIDYLKTKGDVYVVRMPLAASILSFENKVAPDFDAKIEKVTNAHNCTYLNFSKEHTRYQFYDGSHLFAESAKRFTKDLSDSIR